jgi:uncharacterized protein involved in high-affinity Fe2+ transport
MRILILAAALLLATGGGAFAGNHPIGEPVEKNGMRLAAAFIQSVTIDPQDEFCGPVEADIHMTVDIRGLDKNPHGFAVGEWIPDLGVKFEVTKRGTGFARKGVLVPMVANSGPHYGANVKLDGPGRYHVVMTVSPPSQRGFYRHTDRETGVASWWTPFTQEWDFVFVGVGNKGGY